MFEWKITGMYSSNVVSVHAFMSAQLQVLNGIFGPVFWGLRTTKAQTSLPIRAV